MQIKATLVRFVCLLLALSAFGVRAADPQVISIKYNRGEANRQLVTNEFSGVPGLRVGNWNNVSNGPAGVNTSLKSFTAGTVVNNLGIVVPAVTIDIVGATNPVGNFAGGTGSNDVKLLSDPGGVDINQGAGFTPNGGSAVVSNVPYASYSVIAYIRPDGAALNGIQNPCANYIMISNLTGTIGQKVWISGQKIGSPMNFPVTDQFGRGYTQADTRSQPSDIATQIQVGNYVVFTNLTLANYPDGFILYYGVVGGPSAIDGVADTGNINPRAKFAGFQIVSNSTAAVTSLTALTNLPFLFAGNPAPIGSGIIANRADGTTFPANLVAGTVYSSTNASIFTVDSLGNLLAGTNGGVATLFVTNNGVGATLSVTNLAPVNPSHVRLTVTPTNLLLGANGIGNKAQLVLSVDFILPNGTTNATPGNSTLALWNGVSFVSSNTGVATVQNAMPNKGEVTPVGAGAVTMWAQFGSVGNVSSNNFLNVSNSAPAAVLGPPSFGVDIVTVNARGQSTYLYSYLAGIPGFRAPYWNTLLLTGGFELTNSLAGMHDRVGASIASTAYVEVIGTNFSSAQGANANDERIIGTYFQVGLPGFVADTATQERTLAVTNVPYPLYDLYIYLRNENGNGPATRAGRFTVMQYGTNYETRYRRNVQNGNVPDQNTGAGYTEAVPVGNVGKPPGFFEPSDITEVPRGNYVRFSGLTDTSKVVVKYGVYVDQTFVEQTTPAMQLAGFQIVRSTANVQATNLYADITTNVMRLGDPNTTGAGVIRADFNDGTFGGAVQVPEVFQFESLDTSIFTVNSTNGQMLSISNGVGRLKVSFTNSVTPTPIYGTSYVLVLPATKVRITGFTPTNLLVGVGGAAESRTASLQADFTNGVVETTSYITNIISFANLTNVNVTGYNYHQYSTTSNTIVSVGISNGLVTALSVGKFDLTGSLGLSNGTTNGSVTTYTHPINGPDSLAVDIINNVTNGGNFIFSQFAQLSGITGQRMAYWNPLVMTNEPPFTNTPANVHGYIANATDRKGVLQGVTVDVTAVGNNTGAGQGADTNEARIFGTFIDSGGPAGTNTAQLEGVITVTGVPYAIYDAYFYLHNDGGNNTTRVGHFTAAETGETRWRRNGPLPGGSGNDFPSPVNGAGYVEAVPIITNGSIPNAITPFTLGMDTTNSVPQGDYVRFVGLTSPTMTVNWGADDIDTAPGANTTKRLRLAGFQIIRNLQTVLVTNIFVSSPSPIPSLLPGNPIGTPFRVFADFDDGTKNVDITTQAKFTSLDTSKFTVTAAGVVSPVGPGNGTLQITFTNLGTTIPKTNNTVINVGTPTSSKMVITHRVLSIGDANAQSNTTASLVLASFNNGSNNVNVSSFSGISWSSGSGNISVSAGGTLTALSTGLFNLTATYATLVTTSNNIGIVINYNTNVVAGFGRVISIATKQSTRGADEFFTTNDLAGAPGGYRVGYWNNLLGNGASVNLTKSNVFRADGTALVSSNAIYDSAGVEVVPMTLQLVTTAGGGFSAAEASAGSHIGGLTAGDPTLGGIWTNDFKLMGGSQLDKFPTAGNNVLTLSNIPYSSYDVVWYAMGENDAAAHGMRGGQITISNASGFVGSRWMKGARDVGTGAFLTVTTNGVGYVESLTSTFTNNMTYIDGAHFTRIQNVSGSWITVDFNTVGGFADVNNRGVTLPAQGTTATTMDNNARFKTMGVQIVERGSPPGISIRDTGTNTFVLSWPYSEFGWSLRSNNVVTGPVTNWAVISPTLTYGPTNISTVIPKAGTASYFILHNQ